MNKRNIILLSFLFIIFMPVFLNAQLIIRNGWPVHLDNYWNIYSRHNLVTYKLQDGQHVIGAATNGQICLYDINGNPLPGWPVTWEDYLENGNILQGPRMGDMDGDGSPEILVQTRTGSEDRMHRVLIYDIYGNLKPELCFQVQGEPFFMPPNSCPILVDINNDGTDELFHIFDSLYAIDGTGQSLPGFPWALNDTMATRLASPVIGVGEGWPHEDILVVWGTRSRIHARYLSDSEELPGWPIESPENLHYSPITLIPRDNGWIITCVDLNYLYVWDQDGHFLPGFPERNHVSGVSQTASFDVVVGDINGDSEPDLLFRQYSQYLLGYNLLDEALPGFPVEIDDNIGGGEPPVILRTTDSDSAIIIDASACSNWFNRIVAMRYNLRLPWFRVDLPISREVSSLAEVAIIPRSMDTLTVAHYTHCGDLYVLDYAMDMEGAQIIWQMQGNNAGGNRMYKPQAPLGMKEKPTEITPNSFDPILLYPNPSNASFNIKVNLPQSGETTIRIYNLLGKEIFVKAVSGIPYSQLLYNWKGESRESNEISSGIYFISCDDYPGLIKKAVFLR